MKTIGLIGGMSWESTVTYYQVINEGIKDKLGGLHSAKILMYSVDFSEIEENMRKGDWERDSEILIDAARCLEAAGADCILICTNTMHKLADEIRAAIHVPLLHIAEATADVLIENRIAKAALLGTRYTMQQDFYKKVLAERGIEVLIPEDEDIEVINHIIFDELCLGTIREESREIMLRIMRQLQASGAQGVILGCTEIGLLIRQVDSELPVFDTTLIHARAASDFALS